MGSFDNPYKLVIKEISPSRTEIRAITQSLQNTRNPNQISLNFEYVNFINKQVLVAHILDRVVDLPKDNLFTSELETKEFSSKTSDYSSYVEKVNKAFSLSEHEMLKELDQLYASLKEFYKNFLYGSYNEVFSKDAFYLEYLNFVDFTLKTFSRFSQETHDNIKLFYKYMLLQMFDSDLLDSIFYEKFDKYLVNLLNFGSGLAVPILKYANYKDESLSENSNDVLLIKTLTPLDESLVEGTNFYISQNSYSDDIVKNIILRTNYEDISSRTFKLRGPDITQKVTGDSTKQYTLSGEDGLLDKDLTSAEQYFKTTNTEVSNLNVDYTDYKNFVKFSSARSRLDNFVLKLTNISKIQNKINESSRKISILNKEVSLGQVDENVAMSSINILQEEDIKKLNSDLKEIISTLTPYERFLYYEDGDDSWPRRTTFNLYGFKDSVVGANGEYKLYASRKYDLDKVFHNVIDSAWKISWERGPDSTPGSLNLVSKWKLFNDELGVWIYSMTNNLNDGFLFNNENHKGFSGQKSIFWINNSKIIIIFIYSNIMKFII